MFAIKELRLSCFQYVKFIKFESNSQQTASPNLMLLSCFQYVKFIKFESNSQPLLVVSLSWQRCFQYVKFIKFESNSQRYEYTFSLIIVVFSVPKLKI